MLSAVLGPPRRHRFALPVTTRLFRKEAIAASAPSLYGNVIISSDRTITLMALLAVILSASLVTLLVKGTYSSKDRVSGYLAPTAGLVYVFPPRAGVIAHVDIGEGDAVGTGAPLFTVAPPPTTTSGIDVDQIHIDGLMNEQRSIGSRIESERALSEERRSGLVRRIEALAQELESVQAQHETALRLMELTGRDVSRLETLQEIGHVPASLVDARMGDALRAEEASQSLEREIASLESEIASLQSALRQMPLELSLQLDDLRSRSLSIERQLAEAERQKSIVVRAPIAGVIAATTVHVGMAVTPNRQVLSIIPVGEQLQAELLVPAHAAGLIKEGQDVRLRYDAFPYQKFGMYRGRISMISRTILNPEDHVGPVRLPVPAFRVVAQLESQAVVAYGETFQLQPGLTLQADLIRDRRRIIEWIFDPVLAAAMRI